MRKSTAGLLIGVGAALAWFLRGRILGTSFRRPITLITKDGRCGLEAEPEPAVLSKFRDDNVRWEISSPRDTGCDGRREVCVGNWRRGGMPADPPVRNPNGLCRTIHQGNPPVPMVGHINFGAPLGEYQYDVIVDGVVVEDPIVKLVV